MVVETPELKTLCISCLHNKGNKEPCPHCGYDQRQHKNHPLYLKPRTLLKNQYIVGVPLGQGGFGVTYLGLDQWLQKKVAIKEYLPAALATRDVLTSSIIPIKTQEETVNKGLQLFINEARHLAKFDHPNIVRVINFFEDNQTSYMVMEYLDGLSLAEVLNHAGGRLSVEKALTILFPILDALIVVHAQHLYHRDISLQNVRILSSGVPILIDFGAARHIVGEQSRSLDLVLKQGYSPLEQYSSKGKIGPWTDVYACGALLYFLMTGILPAAATDRFCEDNLKSPLQLGFKVSPIVNEAIMRALAIKMEDRFQSVQAFQSALHGQPSVQRLEQSIQPLKPQSQKKKRFIIAILSLLLLIVGVFLFDFTKEKIFLPPLEPLFKQAQTQWAQQKLMTPPGDNAFETYHNILKIAPNNHQAQQGLLNMAKHYHAQALISQKQGHLIQSLDMIQYALQLRPNHAEFIQFKQNVKAKMAAQKQAQQIHLLLNEATQYLTASQWEAALVLYQDILAIAPDHQEAQKALKQIADLYLQQAKNEQDPISKALSLIDKGLLAVPQHRELRHLKQQLNQKQLAQQTQAHQINKLLTQAERQLAVLRLTEPAHDNAYETYQAILTIAPDHPQAQAGFKKIADQYEKLARIERDNLQKNLMLVEKGLKVLPHHKNLIALRETLQQQIHQTILTPPPLVEEKPITPQIPSKVNKPSALSTQKTESPPKIATPNNTIQDLLTLAQRHFELKQLEAALQTYKNILTIEPNNHSAIIGLQHIAYHYEQLARVQYEQNQLLDSLALIKKGLIAYPTHSGLLLLHSEVTQGLNEQTPTEETQPPQLMFTPSF